MSKESIMHKRSVAISVALLALLSATAFADYDAGVAAFKAKNYDVAETEFRASIDELKLAGAEDDPQYWFKMKEASKAFTKALKKLTQKQGHDLIGEIDSMYREDGNEIPDITDAVKKIIEDAGGSTT